MKILVDFFFLHTLKQPVSLSTGWGTCVKEKSVLLTLRQRIITNLCLGHSLPTMHSPIGFDLIWTPPSSKLSCHWLPRNTVAAHRSACAHAFETENQSLTVSSNKQRRRKKHPGCAASGVGSVRDAASKAGLEAQCLTVCRSRKWCDALSGPAERRVALLHRLECFIFSFA